MPVLTALPQGPVPSLPGRSLDGAPGGPDVPATTVPPVVRVVPWIDPVVDAVGTDPRSAYVEQFWLPVLGPSATWVLRRLADRFDATPDGFDLDVAETACSVGIGGPDSRHTPMRRALRRCARFGLLRPGGTDEVAVRRSVGPLPQRLLDRLPQTLQACHRRWQGAPLAAGDPWRRARLLALDLTVLGEAPPDIERRLLGWGIHPALAHQSAGWACARPCFDAVREASPPGHVAPPAAGAATT